MMKHYSTRYWAEYGKRITHLMVPVLFLCSTLVSQAATNWVDGTAYGTNDWSTAGSISSQTNGAGSLIIGHESTTNLTLAHDITGFVFITNKVTGVKVNATGATLTSSGDAVFGALNATNLVISGGRFIGSADSGIGADGGYISDSVATIIGSEFAGVNGTAGFAMESSGLIVSNGIFRGGDSGIGLLAYDHSTVEIHGGSFAGGAGTTAFYLQDSDVTVYDGTFTGNLGGTTTVAGDGLFSELTGATTNHVTLYGGTFSSVAFYGVDDSVQLFMAGTNLVVQNGIIQDGGTVIVDNQNDSALQQIRLHDGTMKFENDFTLGSGGELNLDQSQLVAAGDIEFASDSMLKFNVSTGEYAVIIADTATFQTNSTLFVDVSTALFEKGTNDVDLLEATNGIFVATGGTSTDATTENFNQYVDIHTNNNWLTAFNAAFIDDSKILRLQFIEGEWGDAWDDDGQPKDLVNELQTLDDGTMGTTVHSMSKGDFKTAAETTYFTVGNSFQTTLHGMQAATGLSASRGAEFREQLNLKPSGARGPQRKNDLRGWVKYYGQRYSHDAEGLNPEYETELDGGVIGIDKSIGGLLVGIGGGYGRYSTTSGIDGEENIDAYHGTLYGTFGIGSGYLDAGIAYGFNKVKNRTTSPFVLNGKFDAQIASAHLGCGIDLVDSTEGMVFTPEASIQYSMYEQDAYSETSDTAIPRNIDGFEADSLRGSIGLNVSVQEAIKMQTFSFKYDIRAHWIREFNPEAGTVDFNLEAGGNDYQLTHPMLDEDFYRVGVGCAFFNTKRNQPKNVLFRIDFDELFGDGFNSHNLSAKIICAF